MLCVYSKDSLQKPYLHDGGADYQLSGPHLILEITLLNGDRMRSWEHSCPREQVRRKSRVRVPRALSHNSTKHRARSGGTKQGESAHLRGLRTPDLQSE